MSEPLPDALVGNKLGQFKLEHVVEQCAFIAPKVYALRTTNGNEIIKVKGLSESAIKK